MNNKLIKELNLRLKAPMIAMEKIVRGKYLPGVFACAALEELNKIRRLIADLEKQGRG